MSDILLTFTTAAGAGTAAWWLFAQIRLLFPLPDNAPISPLALAFYRLLYVDALAYLVVAVIAALISFAASAALAWYLGEVPNWDAFLALAIATLIHHAGKK